MDRLPGLGRQADRRHAPEGRGIEAILLGVIPDPSDGRLRGYGSFKAKDIHATDVALPPSRALPHHHKRRPVGWMRLA